MFTRELIAACVLLGACHPASDHPRHTYRLVPLGPLVQGAERNLELADPGQAEPQDLKWKSSDPKVAVVSPDGRVRATGPGSVQITGGDGGGEVSQRISVSTARLRFSASMPLQKRSFVALTQEGWALVKTLHDPACDMTCPGDLFVVSPDGFWKTPIPKVGRLTARKGAWLEVNGRLARWNAATEATEPTGVAASILGIFPNGDLLAAQGNGALRMTTGGAETQRWSFDSPPARAVILDNHRFVVQTAAGLRAVDRAVAALPVPADNWLWGGDATGNLILTDRSAWSFFWYTEAAGVQLLPGRHAVLLGEPGLVQSEGLTASISVPVETQGDKASVYLELRTTGIRGAGKTFDVVYRAGAIDYWRWGPSTCANHPFTMAVAQGYAVIADCNGLVRIDDESLHPAGPWPQPAGDAGRTWAVQP